MIDQTPEEMSDAMLCVIARVVFRLRAQGIYPLDLRSTSWELTPLQTMEVLIEAERRGLIEA